MDAAQALEVTAQRLSAAVEADPRLQQAMKLSREAHEEALRAIGAYGTAGGRGAPALFTERHQDLLQLSCFQMALHLVRPSPECLQLLTEVFPRSKDALRRWVPRPVIDLPCGYGKTESAKAVLWSSMRMHRRGELGDGGYPGALFLADDLAQLDAVAVALKARGLKYGKDFGMYYAPNRTTKEIVTRPIDEADCPNMPILLICVQQLKARIKRERQQGAGMDSLKGADQVLLLADGRQRQLVIKDEVLLGIEAHYFELDHLELTLFTLQKHGAVANQAAYDPLRKAIERCLSAVQDVAAGLSKRGDAGVAELPPMDEGIALLADAAAEELADSDVPHKVLKSIGQIGGLADLNVSVQFRSKKGKGPNRSDRLLICKAVRTWPYERVSEFVTLDANYRADLLTQSMKEYERSSVLALLNCTPEQLKRMHQLKVHISPGLKGSMGQGGRTDLANQRTRAAFIDLIVRTLRPIYRDTPRRTLIFTFKDTRQVSYRDELKAALVEAGVDDSQIHYGSAGIKPQHRVVIETWGRHTSTNAFVDCSAVFFLGILRYEPEKLMCDQWAIEGDEGRSLSDLSLPLAALDRSMLVCHAVQALLRSMARVTIDGMCPPCDAYMILRDPAGNEVAMERELRKLLGDFTLLPWEHAMTKTQLTATIPDLIVQMVTQLFEEGRERVAFSEVRSHVMTSTNAKASNTWAKYRKEADAVLEQQGIRRNAEGRGAKAWVRG